MPNPAEYQSDSDEERLEEILNELDLITMKIKEDASKFDQHRK